MPSTPSLTPHSPTSRSPFPTAFAESSPRPLLRPSLAPTTRTAQGVPTGRGRASARAERYPSTESEVPHQLIHPCRATPSIHSVKQHPGPSEYRKEEEIKPGKGFTMRPKTPNGRNCTLRPTQTSLRTSNARKDRDPVSTGLFWLVGARAATRVYDRPSWDGQGLCASLHVLSNNRLVVFSLSSW